MELWHVTKFDSSDQVAEKGLLIAKARGKMRGVWLVERKRLEWAFLHVSAHQEEDPQRMVAFPVYCVKRELTYRGRSVWISKEDIPACDLGEPITFHELIGDTSEQAD